MTINHLLIIFLILSCLLVCGCGEGYVDDTPLEVSRDSQPIEGGVTATMADWPWIVSLRSSGGSFLCGGSLIAPTWVLTAAHCGTPAYVLIGPDPATALKISVTSRIAHPNYNSKIFQNDIALLKLSQSAIGINPVSINVESTFPDSIPFSSATSTSIANVRTAGWGATYDDGGVVGTLREVALPAITTESCQQAYVGHESIIDAELCVGYNVAGYGPCYGDSGGPLSFWGTSILTGVTSHGNNGCGLKDYPSVYTRVSSFIDWITSNSSGTSTVSPTALILTALDVI